MSEPWWANGLQWILGTALMSLVMHWIAASRLKPWLRSDSKRLFHPPSTLIVGLAGFLFFAGIAVLSNVFANRTTTWWTTAVFVGFALLSVPLIVDYVTARHELSATGLAFGRWTGGRGFVAWTDLRRVAYGHGMKWFVLETQSGEVIRLSAMLAGLPEFARLVLAHAPRSSIDPACLPVLEATAAGNPPSVWE